jgi:hypothetical protein
LFVLKLLVVPSFDGAGSAGRREETTGTVLALIPRPTSRKRRERAAAALR